MAKITKVGHVVLNVEDTQEAIDWYTNTLGMELMVHDKGMDMAFFSFGSQDHDIAVMKAPEGVETGSPGLSHTALMLEGGAPELRRPRHDQELLLLRSQRQPFRDFLPIPPRRRGDDFHARDGRCHRSLRTRNLLAVIPVFPEA